ncbi:MAG: hypothetical protein JWO44_2599 [Bacteroidetes bacterium]|jgi:hypothetical protein|nr:hypothetical protein [Bacteroidota bacterium]
MKRILLIAIVLLFALQGNAQFLNGLGITVGATAANQKFKYHEPLSISRKSYIFGFNASVFLECLSHDNVRWVTEIQFNQKGSVDNQPGASYANRLQYLSWNNYLKFRYEMYRIIPYVLVGPRLEYTFSQGTSSPAITGPFLPLHVSGAVGGGLEFVSFTNFKFFVEGFYNPDIMPAYVAPALHINNKDFELRVGLKYEFAGRKESCNTPTYVE